MRRQVLAALLLFACVIGFAGSADRLPISTHTLPAADAIRAAIAKRDLDEALKLAEQATESQPDNAQAWSWVGRVAGLKTQEASIFGKPRWASRCLNAFEKAADLDPSNPESQWDLMQYFLQAPGIAGGSKEKARQQAENLAEIHPAWGHLARGTLAQADEDLTTAESELRAALVLVPQENRVRLSLAALLQTAERWTDLRDLWTKAHALNPSDPVPPYQLGRLAAITATNLDEGRQHLESLIAEDPFPFEVSHPGAHWRLGQILAHQKNTPAARAAFQAALKLDPDFEEAKKDLRKLPKR